MNMKKNWIFAALSAMMVVSGGYAQEKGGEGLDQEPSKPKAKVDLFAIAKERMTAKRVLNTSTITDTPLAGGRRVVWSIGAKDRSASDLALGPDGFRQFLARDFGFEDRNFIVGADDARQMFPYVLPGPVDTWGGSWPTSGWHTHQLNIDFGVDRLPESGDWTLVVNLLDYAKEFLPLVKVSINEQDYKLQLSAEGYDVKTQKKPLYDQPLVDTLPISGDLRRITPLSLEIPIEKGMIRPGGNRVVIYVLEGSWIMFDNVEMHAPAEARISVPGRAFVGKVEAANYSLRESDGVFQPLLVAVEQLSGTPTVEVRLDGERIFRAKAETGTYNFEAPMPAVERPTESEYEILVDGKSVRRGSVLRSAQPEQTPADYVDTWIGTAHSRWMIAPGPWMPFGMVKMAPDNQNGGWQAGYQPTFENLGAISHIHCWSMAGLGMLPVNGPLQIHVGDQWDPDSGYRSRIDKRSEKTPLGEYSVHLTDYDIELEVTGTTRCGFQRYTFPKDRGNGRVMIDMRVQGEFDYRIENFEIRKLDDHTIQGFSHQFSPSIYYGDSDQEYTVYFTLEFDRPIVKYGGWVEDRIQEGGVIRGDDVREAGAFVEFDLGESPVVQVRSGISYVGLENSQLNLQTEITEPFGWDFDAVCAYNKATWNDLIARTLITTSDRNEKVKFYTNVYRSLCSRSIYSDVNGEWVSADFVTRRLKDSDDRMLGGDAFWNSFWNLNQYWNLVTPEWSKRWVNSELAMYDALGWLSKGAGGMKYINVMVAEHEIPMMVAAHQMGIGPFDTGKMTAAFDVMENCAPRRLAGGYVGNRDMIPYLKYKYVPYELGIFSNTMEYSFDNWAVGQFAKSIGDEKRYELYNDRGYWWRNAINPANGYAQMRDTLGRFVPDFDPFASGAHVEYVEGNAWQLTFFVPQDVPALVDAIGQKEFVDRLQWGFEASEPWRYNAPNDQYWDYPVVQGNQQSMHFAYLFNWAGKPWLTQRWSRSIAERYYNIGAANAYLGDEDQGQMSAWFVMTAMGLFQTDGGARVDPVYEIGSPIYEKIVIDLGNRFGRGKTFTIEAKNTSRKNIYVQRAWLNGERLDSFCFPASELLKGGNLTLEMGPTPNKKWGLRPYEKK